MKLIKYGIAGLGALMIAACGGGDGSSGPTYNGVRTQAILTQQNDKDFAETSFGDSGVGNAFASAESNQSGGSSLQNMVQNFRNITNNIEPANLNSDLSLTAEAINETTNGTCGGTQVISGDANQTTGVFSGSIVFNNYCDADGTVNGSVTFNGSIAPDGSVSSMSMHFNSLSFVSQGGSMVMNGTATVSSSGSTDTIVMTMDFQDSTNQIYRIENLSIQSTMVFASPSSYESVIFSGRVYHPEHGYVTLETLSPVITDVGATSPRSGTVVMHGANSKSTFTVFDTNNYTLTVETNGVSEAPKNCTWNPDQCS